MNQAPNLHLPSTDHNHLLTFCSSAARRQQKNAWLTGITYSGPDHDPRLCRDLCPALVPVCRPARRPCLAERYPSPELTLAPAGHEGQSVVVGPCPELPDLFVEERLVRGLIAVHLRPPFVAPVTVAALVRPAVAAPADWHAGCLAGWNFFPATFLAALIERMQALFAQSAPDSAVALRCHAAGNGNSVYESPFASPLGDIDPQNTAAGRQAAARVREARLRGEW